MRVARAVVGGVGQPDLVEQVDGRGRAALRSGMVSVDQQRLGDLVARRAWSG